MIKQKYIRLESLFGIKNVFILFPFLVNHSSVLVKLGLSKLDVVSAGFVDNYLSDEKRLLKCYGKSLTLNSVSLDEDTKLLSDQHYSEEKNQKYVCFEWFGELDDAIILIPNEVSHEEFTARLGLQAISEGFVINHFHGDQLIPFCVAGTLPLDLTSIKKDTRGLGEQHYPSLAGLYF